MDSQSSTKRSKVSTKAVNNYVARNYERISVVIPKGTKDQLKQAADRNGQSLNRYILECVEQRSGLDLTLDSSKSFLALSRGWAEQPRTASSADGGAAPAAEIVQAAQPGQAAGGDGLTLPAKVARLARQAAKMAGDADALTWVTRALEAAAGAEIEAQEHRRAALDLLEMARNGGKSAPPSAPSIAPPDKKIARDPGASCTVPGVGAVDWAERTARVRRLREDAERQKHIAEQPLVENPEPEQTAPGNSGDLLSEQAGPKIPGD